MSGSGQSHDNGQRQQLVFCHECENEWYKDGSNALTCPSCHSDFTEIIEQDFDPRRARQPGNPLLSHNPWADADDPDEEDIEDIDAEHFGGGHGHHARNPQPSMFGSDQLPNPLINDFTSMMQHITGARGMPPGFGPPNQGDLSNDGRFRPRSAPGMRPHGTQTRVVHETGPHGGFRIQYTSGPGYSFTHTGGNGFMAGGGFRGSAPGTDVNALMQNLFGGMLFGAPGGGASGHHTGAAAGGPFNPFSAILSSIFDPANARHGDAVFSQEALDRVISQLMEQNPGGSAPGPALASAIQALPKKPLSMDMLDENTGQAECSICMDNVEVGTEVTTLPCGHWFHFSCVEAWLKEHDTCPVCRRGIMPKDGPQDRARTPGQAPLHDEGATQTGRRQSGTRDHPFVVDESPTQERRRRRPSDRQGSSGGFDGGRSGNAAGGVGGGIADRMRNFFGGGAGGSGAGGSSSAEGNRNPPDWRR